MRNPLPIPLQPSITSSDCVLQNTDTSSCLQPSITSSDCVLQTQIPLVIYNCQLLHWTASSKHRYLSLFATGKHFIGLRPPNTDTSSYLEPSIIPSDCVLLQAADVGILGTFTFASIIPSCSFTFASIIPSCSFPFLRVIPTLFSFLLKLFYFTCSCYFFEV